MKNELHACSAAPISEHKAMVGASAGYLSTPSEEGGKVEARGPWVHEENPTCIVGHTIRSFVNMPSIK